MPQQHNHDAVPVRAVPVPAQDEMPQGIEDTRIQPWKAKIVVNLPDDQQLCSEGEVRLQNERDVHDQRGG